MPDDIRCRLVLAVGLPGSGKSSYLANLGVNAISSDEMRRLIADDATDQTIHARVFRAIRFLVAERLRIGRPVTYVDATHLTRKEREPYLRLARPAEADVEILYFDTPLEVCLDRNRGRERVVPEEAIRAMAAKLEPPSAAEGFTRVTAVEWKGDTERGRPTTKPG